MVLFSNLSYAYWCFSINGLAVDTPFTCNHQSGAFDFLFKPKKEVYVKPNFGEMNYDTKVATLKLLVNDPLLYTDPYTLVK